MPRVVISPVARPGGAGNARRANSAAVGANNPAPLHFNHESHGARSGGTNSDIRAISGLKLDIYSLISSIRSREGRVHFTLHSRVVVLVKRNQAFAGGSKADLSPGDGKRRLGRGGCYRIDGTSALTDLQRDE